MSTVKEDTKKKGSKKMKIWFDMDGTIADLYSVDRWLQKLEVEDATPYLTAKPMLNMNSLAKLINILQNRGYEFGIISWCSKGGSESYDQEVTKAKQVWLKNHLGSVTWDSLLIVPYGTEKHTICGSGILFDDNEGIRKAWDCGEAYEPDAILETLRMLL